MTEDLITKVIALPSKIGKDRVNHDFSLDYAAYMSLLPELVRTEQTNESLKYHLENDGTVEMKKEITGMGKVVVHFNNCPIGIYEGLRKVEEQIIKLANTR